MYQRSRITLNLCLKSWKEWSYRSSQRSTEASCFFVVFFCEHLRTNKHKTKLADLSKATGNRPYFVYILREAILIIMVLLFANKFAWCKYTCYWQTPIQCVVLSTTINPYKRILPHSVELLFFMLSEVVLEPCWPPNVTRWEKCSVILELQSQTSYYHYSALLTEPSCDHCFIFPYIFEIV